ncbi:hypothetical protein P4133_10685 [Pseudomonas aeruginosa]|nr:hypothetical protein [Pseudomonas aeruginosa]MDF5919858.1 hypothetical protein [Pseudomonas aeruginosa]MDF5987313.1 hypothetical protein [Pseudomonas aeruginosa]MDF5995473.1 hypothetical protein [Pseudomonas aeruginosa]
MPLEITSVKSDDGSTTYEEFDDWNMTGAGIEIVEGVRSLRPRRSR